VIMGELAEHQRLAQMSNESAGGFLPLETLDRAVHLRGDVPWLQAQLMDSARLIFTWQGCNLFSVGETKRPLLLAAPRLASILDPIFLGIRPDGASLFAADLSESQTEQEALTQLGLTLDQARFTQLRQFDGSLSPEDRALLFYSRSMTHWHQVQKYCSRCGSPTRPEEAGHVMACTNSSCAAKYFPRTDPATIMLVHDGDRCLLGRQPSWPAGVYSTLAGFVEPGETAEEAVFREVKEESGVEVRNIRYFGSQPWPFPQSLMLGFFAEATTTDIKCGTELADVRWFEVSEARELLKRLAARFPHLDTIARRLIRSWLEAQG
jgi:NAD+ diphosphatase